MKFLASGVEKGEVKIVTNTAEANSVYINLTNKPIVDSVATFKVEILATATTSAGD